MAVFPLSYLKKAPACFSYRKELRDLPELARARTGPRPNWPAPELARARKERGLRRLGE
jgi:hypothetical protein